MDHQAFAEMLGNYGEFIGSVAVLATLVFLSLQFRQYRMTLSSSTAHQTYQQLNQLNAMLAQDPKLAEIFERAFADPASLDEMEQRRYAWMQTCYVNVLQNLYEQFRDGACNERLFLDFAYQVKWALSTPGGRLWRERNNMHLDLMRYLDELPDLERTPAPAFNLN
jgi:hypothetical protein